MTLVRPYDATTERVNIHYDSAIRLTNRTNSGSMSQSVMEDCMATTGGQSLTAAQRLLLLDSARAADEARGLRGGVFLSTRREMHTAETLQSKGLVTIEPEGVRDPPRAVATLAGHAVLPKPRKSVRYRVEAQRRRGATSGMVLWSEATNVEAPSAKAAAVVAGMPNTYRTDGRVHMGGRYSDPAAVPGSDTTVWVVSYESADTKAVLRHRTLDLALAIR